MLENSLIAGSESEYGLYVTSVCGIELIWSEENPHYWAFYINGEYAQTGVDTTEAEEDALYIFKAEYWSLSERARSCLLRALSVHSVSIHPDFRYGRPQ